MVRKNKWVLIPWYQQARLLLSVFPLSNHMHFSVCITPCTLLKALACSHGQSPNTFSGVAFNLLVTHVSEAVYECVSMQLAGRSCGVWSHAKWGRKPHDLEWVGGPPAASSAPRGLTKAHIRCAAVWYSASHCVTCPGFLHLGPQISD